MQPHCRTDAPAKLAVLQNGNLGPISQSTFAEFANISCYIRERPGKKVAPPMKLVAALVALLCAVCSSYAQDRPIIPPSPHSLSEICVDVEIGNERAPSLGCLNRRLKLQVDRVAPSLNVPPIDARSQDTRVGVANTVAVQQQYGQNFGRSAIPFRPQPTFANPLAIHR
jgi:hypothetical protein